MIRTLKNNDYDPKGFIFILSPFMFDCKTNQMTSSCLTVNIDTSITWPILYENINKNKEVFNGMLYHDFSLLKIINIWEKDVTDLLFQWFLLPYEINDKVYLLEIMNYNSNDDILNTIFTSKDFNSFELIFFTDIQNWSNVVDKFKKANLFINDDSNQRHIFNPLHNKMSKYLNTLFGTDLTNNLSYYDFEDKYWDK